MKERSIKTVLRELYMHTGLIDNGYCAICRGHRVWDVKAQPRIRALPCEKRTA